MIQYNSKRAIIWFTVAAWLALFQGQAFSQSATLMSPDQQLSVQLSVGSTTTQLLQFRLQKNGKDIFPGGQVGFLPAAPVQYIDGSAMPREADSEWHPVTGQRATIPDRFNEVTLAFRTPDDKDLRVTVTCRLYNEGFAYRYELTGKQELSVADENSCFVFAKGTKAWVSSTAQGIISQTSIPMITGRVERPLTLSISSDCYLALGEAGLVNFARMKFRASGDTLFSSLDGPVNTGDSLESPWRFVLVGESPGDLLEKNYLLLNLNTPNQIPETSWIKPGKVIREVTLTTEGSYRTIDFAASHGIQYILYDAGWYGREDADTSDAKRVNLDPLRSKGPLDLPAVIAYGNKKGVGVFLYVNRRALERQGDTLFALYEKWGIAGIKFGFVQVGSQQWTNWLHDRVRSAARHHLLVDIHDEYRPTGYSRTYPNLLTQEGIRGDEESPDLTQTIKTIFTRSIAGAADNTNCYFTERVDKMGSHTAQMAKAIAIYSPLQFLFWYDRPARTADEVGKEAILRELPDLNWYKDIPVTWDETQVLESDMEDYVTLVRRKENNWYLASLNAKAARNVNWSCNFLGEGSYTATIYEDDGTGSSTSTGVRIRTQTDLRKSSVLKLKIPAESGVVIQLVKN